MNSLSKPSSHSSPSTLGLKGVGNLINIWVPVSPTFSIYPVPWTKDAPISKLHRRWLLISLWDFSSGFSAGNPEPQEWVWPFLKTWRLLIWLAWTLGIETCCRREEVHASFHKSTLPMTTSRQFYRILHLTAPLELSIQGFRRMFWQPNHLWQF